ncbi:hypothetical protein F4802DRAFT_507916 [Xylaria palmicola]|nr:hypothetical protein F4802DRAFT_507916 [Xylaria palmicola]
MTSQSQTMPPQTTAAVEQDQGNDNEHGSEPHEDHDDDGGAVSDDGSSEASEASSSSSSSSIPSPQFRRFADLPPELRHHIWRFAAPPSPGINFFNVHCFPYDHAGCNRSTSPPWAYLDLRRLDVEHDDAAVARYDPSSWQGRAAVRAACHEARVVCAVPASRAATVTLTRPRRGLFVRARDGQLRKTRLHIQEGESSLTEPVVRRAVQVHVDDILSLSVENCSFNMPHEERPSFSFSDDEDADEDEYEDGDTAARDAVDGWAYDPQLMPKLPQAIPAGRLCANLARCSTTPLRITTDALFGLLYGHIPGFLDLTPEPDDLWPGRLLLMFDSITQAAPADYDRDRDPTDPTTTTTTTTGRAPNLQPGEAEEKEEVGEVVHDRFGDRYIRLPWHAEGDDFRPPAGFPVMHRLAKVWPESNCVRVRYLWSGLALSSKRPARSA